MSTSITQDRLISTININMRCIEMLFFEGHSPTTTAININMRCIEMPGQ